jgi:hypothetical protein
MGVFVVHEPLAEARLPITIAAARKRIRETHTEIALKVFFI